MDMAVVGDVRATVNAIGRALKLDVNTELAPDTKPDVAALEAEFPDSGPHASDALIVGVLKHLDPSLTSLLKGHPKTTLSKVWRRS